jgi:hypothetical protein
VRRIACDAALSRVLLGEAGEPLAVGPSRRVVSGALRRAPVARDGGCRFPGCDRPPAWTDAHHLEHWADGGATTLTNTGRITGGCTRGLAAGHRRCRRLPAQTAVSC